jgi:hypothetical protein
MLCEAVAIGTRAWNVGASRAERAQASLGLVIERSRRYRLNPHHTDEITRFVRGTLGCQCPDDVFQSIVIGQERASNNGAPFTRLLVGARLLIYVLPASSIDATPDTLAALARQGRAERDTRGYNRFRLVIASRDTAAQSTAARAVFDAALGHDDKAHLHLVAGSEIPIALGIV